jgi:hypothetical protein
MGAVASAALHVIRRCPQGLTPGELSQTLAPSAVASAVFELQQAGDI